MEEKLFIVIGKLYVQAQSMQDTIIALDKDVKLKNALIQDLQSNVGNIKQDNVQIPANKLQG